MQRWQEGSAYYPVPLGVTIKEIKEGKLKTAEVPTMFDAIASGSQTKVKSPPKAVVGSTG